MPRRARRTPPTPAQRRRMIIIGALLVAFACFTMIYETLAWESGRLVPLIIVLAVLFCVFILPIISTVRHARRSRL